jgi:L-asparaginase
VALTHGTSTLEETAYFLHLTVRTKKPIVLTGAMRPMTAMSNDAEINLYDCVRVAASPAAHGRGVLIVLNGQLHSARDVTKTNTSRIDAFKSGDLGLLGYSDVDGQVVFYREPIRKHTDASAFDATEITDLPRVDIGLAYAGCDRTAIDALAAAPCAGLVAAGLGSGGAPKAFVNALSDALAAGIPIVVSSQVGTGRVMARRAAYERGFVFADNLPPRKARILLMLALTRTRSRDELQQIFDTH